MPNGFLSIVGAITMTALVLAALCCVAMVAAALWGRFAPAHWWLSGPMREARPAAEVFRDVDARGGRAATIRRWLRVGPWAVYAVRYEAGPTIPTSDKPATVQRRRPATPEESTDA